MITEGKITIEFIKNGSVHLISNRSTSVSDLLIGCDLDKALELLSVVFSLCAHAHVAAARSALGYSVTPQDIRVVLAENAREHLLRIIMGWKGADDIIQMPAPPVMRLVSDMQSDRDGSLVAENLSNYLQSHVLGCSPKQFLQIGTVVEFDDWLSNTHTAAAVYLSEITNLNWRNLGACPTRFLPKLDNDTLLERLSDQAFTQQPDWLGSPRETGPFARQSSQLLIADLVKSFGSGLISRMVARLVELAILPDQIQNATDLSTSTSGFGIIETARGRLIHAAKHHDSVITDYSILAPTEWNFHPDGIAAHSLRGLNARQARAMVEAIDPCVDFELRVA